MKKLAYLLLMGLTIPLYLAAAAKDISKDDFYLAINQGDFETVSRALGNNPEWAKDKDYGKLKTSPLLEAISSNQKYMVKILVDTYKAPLDAVNEFGRTALLLAVDFSIKGSSYQDIEKRIWIINYLVLKGASWRQEDKQKENALTYAAYHGNLKALQALIESGIEVDAANSEGTTALMAAVNGAGLSQDKNFAVIKYLLDLNANIIQANNKGESPLSCDMIPEIRDLLNEKWRQRERDKARAPMPSKEEIRNFSHNLNSDNTAAIYGAIWKCPSIVSMPNDYGETPFMNVIEKGNLKMADILLRFNIDVNCRDDKYGETALIKALRSDSLRKDKITTIQYLLDKKINVDLADRQGKTPLMHAVRTCELDVVNLLIKKGHVQVDLQDKNKNTALIHAALATQLRDSKSSLEIINALLQAHAKKYIQNSEFKTAYDYVQDPDMKKFLAKAMGNFDDAGGLAGAQERARNAQDQARAEQARKAQEQAHAEQARKAQEQPHAAALQKAKELQEVPCLKGIYSKDLADFEAKRKRGAVHVLGLKDAAAAHEPIAVAKAFRTLALQWHSDKHLKEDPVSRQEADAIFKILVNAQDALTGSRSSD